MEEKGREGRRKRGGGEEEEGRREEKGVSQGAALFSHNVDDRHWFCLFLNTAN